MGQRRRQRGFFIIWGSKNITLRERHPPVVTECPSCHRRGAMYGKATRPWFTIYIVIPLFPIGAKIRFTECSLCKAQFRASIEEFGQAAVRAKSEGGEGFQAAIALYNEMRETPADSAKLLRLLKMYEELGEPREVISAGQTYPAALEGSDECLVTLGQAYGQQGQFEAAVRCFAAALALNPSNAAAQAGQEAAMTALHTTTASATRGH